MTRSVPPQHNVTQKDIADRAGVSVMTVSRALSGKAGVSQTLRQRIQSLAEDMGYCPNPLVMSLMRTRNKGSPLQRQPIGWYGQNASLRESASANGAYDTFREYKQGVLELCEQRGFRLEELNPQEISMARAVEILEARGIGGLLLGPDSGRERGSPSLHRSLHIVQIGRSRGQHGHDRIVTDSYHGMRTCIRKLREAGYQRIGYVDDLARESRNELRHQAAFLVEFPRRADLIRLKQLEEDSSQLLHSFLAQKQPDAVILGGNSIIRSMISKALPVPFAVLSRNGLPQWVSGMEVRHRDMGAEAARRVIDALLGPQHLNLQGHSVSLSETWHEGSSHLQ